MSCISQIPSEMETPCDVVYMVPSQVQSHETGLRDEHGDLMGQGDSVRRNRTFRFLVFWLRSSEETGHHFK